MTTNDVLSIVNAVPPPATEGDNAGATVPPPGEPLAVAKHLLPDWQHQGVLTLRHWRGAWMRWRHSHWAEIEPTEIRAELYQRLGNALYSTADGPRPWAPTRRKLADLEDALAAQVYLPADVDAPTWLTDNGYRGPIVACRNGLLRVRDRRLMEHNPRFFNLASCPFDYDENAPEPKRWMEFLRQLWPDDDEAIRALQEYFGYILSGRTDLHKIMLIVGPTRSGKGTIGRVLTALVGRKNMAGPTLASLGTNFGLAPLLGKPLAIVSDARLGGGATHQVVERLLTISGEDTIDVDRKYREPWTGRLPTRFLILSNELPNFADASGAIARRFIILTMQRSFLGRENTRLTQELLEELPGILNWALDGLVRLEQQGGITEPASSVSAIQAMVDSASPMTAFVRECCSVQPNETVPVAELFRAWRWWCDEQGRTHPGTLQSFGRQLQAVVPQVRVARPRTEDGSRQRVYQGIALKPEVAEELRNSPRWIVSGDVLPRVPGQ